MHTFYNHLYTINDVVQFRLPGRAPTVVVFDPEEMLKVHKASGPQPLGSTNQLWPFVKYFAERQTKYKGTPMAFSDGQDWKHLRHAMQEGLFGYEDAQSYVPLIAQVGRDIAERIPKHEKDILQYLNLATFELIHSVIFGIRTNVLEESKANPVDLEFVKATFGAFKHGADLMFDPVASMIAVADKLPPQAKASIPQSAWEKYDYFCQSMNSILDIGAGKVKQLIAESVESKYKSDSTGTKPLLVRYILSGQLNEDQMVLNVAGLLQGGVDTTANTLAWSLTRLAQFPHVQKPLRDEIRAVKPNPDALWTAEELGQLKLLSSFVDETMRLVPTAQGHLRTPLDDCVVTSRRQNVSYTIPKGSRVQFISSPLQNDPSIVSNPAEFKVDRFTRECKHARRGTPEAKIDHPLTDVFSWGPRMCLGARLAKIELVLTLAEVIGMHNIGFQDSRTNRNIGVFNSFLTRPDPIPEFRFTKAT